MTHYPISQLEPIINTNPMYYSATREQIFAWDPQKTPHICSRVLACPWPNFSWPQDEMSWCCHRAEFGPLCPLGGPRGTSLAGFGVGNLQTLCREGATLLHHTLTDLAGCMGCRESPRGLGTEAIEQCLTFWEMPDHGLHLGPPSFSIFQHLVATDAEPSLSFTPSALYKGFLFSQVLVVWVFFLFICDLIHTNSFLF